MKKGGIIVLLLLAVVAFFLIKKQQNVVTVANPNQGTSSNPLSGLMNMFSGLFGHGGNSTSVTGSGGDNSIDNPAAQGNESIGQAIEMAMMFL